MAFVPAGPAIGEALQHGLRLEAGRLGGREALAVVELWAGVFPRPSSIVRPLPDLHSGWDTVECTLTVSMCGRTGARVGVV